jgi:hypothetical protein
MKAYSYISVFFENPNFQNSHYRVCLCSPGCPETHSLDQAGLELRNLPASASQVAGIMCLVVISCLCFYTERQKKANLEVRVYEKELGVVEKRKFNNNNTVLILIFYKIKYNTIFK